MAQTRAQKELQTDKVSDRGLSSRTGGCSTASGVAYQDTVCGPAASGRRLLCREKGSVWNGRGYSVLGEATETEPLQRPPSWRGHSFSLAEPSTQLCLRNRTCTPFEDYIYTDCHCKQGVSTYRVQVGTVASPRPSWKLERQWQLSPCYTK